MGFEMYRQDSLDRNSIEATLEAARRIRTRPFLYKIYLDLYAFLERELSTAPSGPRLELGSGGGFLGERVPNLITSDIVPVPTVDLVASSVALPFEGGSLSAICMMNVLHHMGDVSAFFHEAERCLKPGGKIVMIETANTAWARFYFSHYHHEPCDPGQTSWQLPDAGRLSNPNQALPWIVFCRDDRLFSRRHAGLRLASIGYTMPFRYILSGGASRARKIPDWSFPLLRGLEWCLSPLDRWLGLFMQVVVHRV
uniref:Methyltransferase domain-containing protein n=1 Tax=Candidatus Kentrum sp. LFY TaxID=2126342 RepID=A0A450UDG0_9GAMM|nr:MAG: Methyltransferase domain-containing protein [Candidatus Kentron sp. LFY]